MTFNVISDTLFLFVMVLFFPSLIFAPWTTDNPPKIATGFRDSCPGWIQFNGFTSDNYPENIKRANNRNVMLDQEATTFAAMYAFYIVGLKAPQNKMLPHTFCHVIFNYNANDYLFIKLKDDFKTCPDWILSYGFAEYVSNYHIGSTSNQDTANNVAYADVDILGTSYNIVYARNQDPDNMNAISIFAYSYYDYLIRGQNQPRIKPSEFCASMGIDRFDIIPLKQFISANGPELTCRAWIELYGFYDNIDFNIQKALKIILNKESSDYKKMPHITRLYVRRLRALEINDSLLKKSAPLTYCKNNISHDESATFSFNYIHVTYTWDGYT